MPAPVFNVLKRITQSRFHPNSNGNVTYMKTRSIFLDGRMVKASLVLIDALAPGVVDGKGVFETMRVYNGRIFGLEHHLDRLVRGLKSLKIRSSYSKKQYIRHLYRTIRANRLRQARIRLAVWRERRRLRISIVCQSFGGYSERQYQRGLKAVISDVRRAKTWFSHIKSMDYTCFHRAFKEAETHGYDEAILLNSRKELVEGSRTNVFFIKKNTLYTPAVKCGCLNGITRQIVMKHARQMNIPCRTVHAGIRKLLRADEAFVTNSLMGVMPLTAVGTHPIGRGKTGALTRRLLRAYHTNVHSSCSLKSESV